MAVNIRDPVQFAARPFDAASGPTHHEVQMRAELAAEIPLYCAACGIQLPKRFFM